MLRNTFIRFTTTNAHSQRPAMSADISTACLILALASMLTLSACYNTILEIDSKTGYYADPETKKPAWDTGIVVTSTPINLDDFKSLIVIDDSNYIATANGSENFTLDRIKELDYFDEAINLHQLLKIIEENQINHLDIKDIQSNTIGADMMQAISKSYRPFLLLSWGRRRVGSGGPKREFYQLVLTEASSQQVLFVVETRIEFTPELTYIPSHELVTLTFNHYPMLNALIDYIRKNSKQYQDDKKPFGSVAPKPAPQE